MKKMFEICSEFARIYEAQSRVHSMSFGNDRVVPRRNPHVSHRNPCKFTADFKHFLHFSPLLLDMGS